VSPSGVAHDCNLVWRGGVVERAILVCYPLTQTRSPPWRAAGRQRRRPVSAGRGLASIVASWGHTRVPSGKGLKTAGSRMRPQAGANIGRHVYFSDA
jgi:hypothetical protein